MTETILTEFGYKVLTASSGQKALAILARDDVKVDLVVTDLVMPGMSGRELVERIRQLSAGNPHPVHERLCDAGGQTGGHALSAKALHERGIAGQSEAGHHRKSGC